MGSRTEAYVTDHMTIEGMTADVGLRMDSWDGRVNWLLDPHPTRRLWSPRVGLAHPLTDNTRLFYNYGHFYDTNSMILRRPDLESPRTIQYEVGIDRNLLNIAWLQVVAWNKKRDRGFSRTTVAHLDENGQSTVSHLQTNNLFSDSYGVSIRTEWNTPFFSGYLYHERSLATTEFLGKTEIDLRPPPYSDGWISPEETSREPEQARTSMVLRWKTPFDFRPWGVSPLLTGAWGLTLRWDTTPDHKIFWDPDAVGEIPVGSSNLWVRGRSLWHLRLEKGLAIGNTRLTAFVDIRNLFNSRRLNRRFFRGDEWDDYVFSLHTNVDDPALQGPVQEGWATDAAGYVPPRGDDMVGDMPEYAVVPQFDRWALWLDPRYIRWGIRLDF